MEKIQLKGNSKGLYKESVEGLRENQLKNGQSFSIKTVKNYSNYYSNLSVEIENVDDLKGVSILNKE